MSWQATDAVLKHSTSRGAARMVLFVIASHADSTGRGARLALTTIVKEAMVSERAAQYALTSLEESGELVIPFKGNGKGNASVYDLSAFVASHTAEAKGAEVAPLHEQQRVQKATAKGANLASKGAMVAPQPIEPEIQPRKTNSATQRAPRKSKRKASTPRPNKRDERQADPRSKYPAIQLVKQLTGYYPRMILYDKIIGVLGDHPDFRRARDCATEWAGRGFRMDNHNWIFDWYVNGIPERMNGHAISGGNRQNAKSDRSETNVRRWGEIASDPDFGFAEDSSGSPPGVDDPFDRGDGFSPAARAVA